MRTIKEHKAVSEGYTARSGDEKRFIDKHVVAKHADRNGNDDGVFKAKKMKTVRRMLDRHGYDVGKDHEVYEETLSEEGRENKAFVFKHTPGDEKSEKHLSRLKSIVRDYNSTASSDQKLRIIAKGRMGKNNPNAEKYKKVAKKSNYKNWGGSHPYQTIALGDAKHHDIYLHPRKGIGTAEHRKASHAISMKFYGVNEEVEVNEAKVVRYTRPDGTTALKSLNKHGKRKDWRDSEGGLKAALAHAGVDKINEGTKYSHKKLLKQGYVKQKGNHGPDGEYFAYYHPHGDKKLILKANVREDVEQINELSKGTLKSYIKKANPQVDSFLQASRQLSDKASETGGYDKRVDRINKWAKNRISGINSAEKKLASKKD